MPVTTVKTAPEYLRSEKHYAYLRDPKARSDGVLDQRHPTLHFDESAICVLLSQLADERGKGRRALR